MTSNNPFSRKLILVKEWRACLAEVARGIKASAATSQPIIYAAGAVGLLASAYGLAALDTGGLTTTPVKDHIFKIGGDFLLGAGAATLAGYALNRAIQKFLHPPRTRTRPRFYQIGTALPFAAAIATGATVFALCAQMMPETKTQPMIMADYSCPNDAEKAVAKIAKPADMRITITCTRPEKHIDMTIDAYVAYGT